MAKSQYFLSPFRTLGQFVKMIYLYFPQQIQLFFLIIKKGTTNFIMVI